MKHHLSRAKKVYQERGLLDLASASLSYVPIELNNFIFRAKYGPGKKVMEEDWDTLVLLDACRYDMFAEQVEFEGELGSHISLGSTSEEFLDRNFSDGTFHDTVYVNANVYFPKLGLDQDETFHATIDLLDDWDPDLEIAHPETVFDAAKEAHEQYPNKRVIVHFMQPHIPFIGEYGQQLQEQFDYRSVWKPFRRGERPISLEEVWRAYNENLEIVLEYVKSLREEISGKMVVSADHGNMVGERQGPIPTRKMYGHPWGVYTPQLVQVPWFVFETEERRNVTTDPPVSVRKQPDDLIEDRLQSLGYKD